MGNVSCQSCGQMFQQTTSTERKCPRCRGNDNDDMKYSYVSGGCTVSYVKTVGGGTPSNYMEKHTLTKKNFNSISVPQSVRNKPESSQKPIVAAMYKKMLFSKQPKRPHLGGWLFLSTKNYKQTKNAKLLSPEQLGYTVIAPKYNGDTAYEKSFIKHVRDGTIKINSCKGKTGSFYVVLTVSNTSNQPVVVQIPKGQVFEQDRFRKVQNLAVTGFYNNGVSSSLKPVVNSDNFQITIPPNATNCEVRLKCYCIDHHYSCPGGEDMNACPLICNCAANSNSQNGCWTGLDQSEIY